MLEPFQSAYRKSYSTETALNHITDTLYKSHDSSHCAQLLLLDLSNAFDTLNHNILIERIKYLGIEGSPFIWLISFFTDSTLYVKIKDFISPPNNISSMIPHGSVLGPLLFSIYMRPLSDIINKLSKMCYHMLPFVTMYSDDIQLIIKFPLIRLPLICKS